MSRLWSDDRGNTTIPALFGAGFLIGGVWYLVGLGDAMVFHESMQDGADATTFASTVIQARGMNVLSLVNLVMSAILAILVAVKIVQLLLMAANVIACAIPFNPYCPLLSSWQSPYSSFVKLTDRTVSTVNRGLYVSETALAKVMPVIGQVKSIATSQAYAPVVEGGFTAGISLVPGNVGGGGHLGGAGGGGGQRWGLPVEDEEYKNLCLHAAEGVKEILFKPLKFLPGSQVIVKPIEKLAGHLIEKLVKSFPQYFCGSGGGSVGAGAGGGGGGLGGAASSLGGSGSLGGAISTIGAGRVGGTGSGGSLASAFGDTFEDFSGQSIDKVASSLCAEAMKTAKKVPNIPGMANNEAMSMASCTSGLTTGLSSVSGIARTTTVGGGGMAGGANKQTSKKIHNPAAIGSDYYASYGFVFSRYLQKRDVDPNLTAASWDRVPKDVLNDQLDRLFSQVQFSKSEFYYDPRRGGPTQWQGGAGSMKEDSMLNMRWRARLRKYRPPTPDAQSLLGGSGLGSILRSIPSGGVDGMGPGTIIGVVLGRDPEQMARWIDSRIGDAPSRATGGVLH